MYHRRDVICFLLLKEMPLRGVSSMAEKKKYAHKTSNKGKRQIKKSLEFIENQFDPRTKELIIHKLGSKAKYEMLLELIYRNNLEVKKLIHKEKDTFMTILESERYYKITGFIISSALDRWLPSVLDKF